MKSLQHAETLVACRCFPRHHRPANLLKRHDLQEVCHKSKLIGVSSRFAAGRAMGFAWHRQVPAHPLQVRAAHILDACFVLPNCSCCMLASRCQLSLLWVV